MLVEIEQQLLLSERQNIYGKGIYIKAGRSDIEFNIFKTRIRNTQ